MARKKKGSSKGRKTTAVPSLRRRVRRWLKWGAIALNVALPAVGGTWYLCQPPERKAEVRMLLGNYLERNRRIRLTEIARDVYVLYYSDQFTASEFEGGDDKAYAGRPEAKAVDGRVRTLRNRGYEAGYCDLRKSPLWVAFRVFEPHEPYETGERPESFEEDRRTAARVQHADFSGSGFDRGHLAPNFAIARCYGGEAREETFLMSNIVPQPHAFNAGIWRALEMREALNYTGRFHEVWVITGPVQYGHPERLESGVPIPDACYRIHVDEHEGRLRVQALLIPQDAPAGASLARYLTTVDEIESLTGLDFFTELDCEVEEAVEAAVAPRVW